jgi:UDP-3-O-[3-hydroxymyristoyl] glucosamine N-acyltransferase
VTDGATLNTDFGAARGSGVEPDSRFFYKLGGRKASDLAHICGGRLDPSYADKTVETVGSLERASGAAITFCEDTKKFSAQLAQTGAGAVFLRDSADAPADASFTPIYVKDPKAAFAKAARLLIAERRLSAGPHVHPESLVGKDVIIEPGAVIGEGARIGDGSRIGANAVIHPGVTIGRNTQVGSGASVQCALIGDHVVVGPNATIGCPGFGLVTVDGESQDLPQFGRAILQDSVSLGANSCVDRGAFADTLVGEGTKIDNLVHIAHNVVIGRNVVILACSGISGSVTIGDGALLAGAVGVGDHIDIGAGAILAARSGVICDIPPGKVWAGYPARPRQQWLREAAWLSRSARRKQET